MIAQPKRQPLATRRAPSVAVAYQRLMIVMLLFVMVTVALGVQLVRIGYAAITNKGAAIGAADAPPRADIVDRNGEVLARSIDGVSIAIHPSKLLNTPEELAPKLAALMPEHTAAEYQAVLTNPPKAKNGVPLDFIYLHRRALPDLVARVNALGEPAIDYVREPQRLYPQVTLAAHVLGFTDFQGGGVSGMERAFDKRLSDPAQRGTPLVLSLDTRVQEVLESELASAMVKHSADAAAGLVLDVNTGEVIAMASLPVFNPNHLGHPSEDAMRNGVTQLSYELGSTFKPITYANALDTHTVTQLSKRFDATSHLHIGKFEIADDEDANRWLNMPEALVHSSNIVTAQIDELLGQEKIASMFRRLDFDKPPHIELHERSRPIWPDVRTWSRATVMTTGYGYGVSITPLQLASAYAALVNGGLYRPATLLKVDPAHLPPPRRVFSAQTSLTLRKMMRLVVMEGTGRKANVDGMRVGGKTGTAKKHLEGQRGYDARGRVSMFASAFPMDAPRYVVLTMLNNPHGTAETGGAVTAGMVSAPIAGKVIARIGPMLGITPDTTKDIDVSDIAPLLWKPKGER